MIADYFREITAANRNTIMARLPEVMPLWGKFRMADGGDHIRTVMAISKRKPGRDMSYVRVSVFALLCSLGLSSLHIVRVDGPQ